MSVRPAMAASNFHPSHRTNWPLLYHPYQHHHLRARQFHPPPSRTMAMMHGPHTTASSQPNLTPALSHHEPSFFEDSFNHELGSTGGDIGAYQQWPDPQCFNLHNFRPADSVDTSFTSSFGSMTAFNPVDINDAVRKIDNSPVLPALSYKVDTSKYENVDYEDYVLRSMEYESSSPSSIETESTGPPTPTSPGMGSAPFRSFYDDPFLVPTKDSFVAKVESAPFQSRPDVTLHGYPSMDLSTGPVPLSMVFNDHHMASSQHAFALQPHAHGGLTNDMTSHQGFIAPTVQPSVIAPSVQPSVTTDSFDMSSTSSVLDLERPFLDTTSEEDTESESESTPEFEANDRAVSEAKHRRDRDSYLLKMREEGYSYKEIKRRGRFTEAESTLRGRVRVMTKHKSERVRKPVWTENDLQLLEEAVDIVVDSESTRDRVPWKKISEWMKKHGSSYFFAGATCARKWKEMYG